MTRISKKAIRLKIDINALSHSCIHDEPAYQQASMFYQTLGLHRQANMSNITIEIKKTSDPDQCKK